MNVKEDGQLIAWCVYDPANKELVLICTKRADARQIADECDGRVAKVVSSH